MITIVADGTGDAFNLVKQHLGNVSQAMHDATTLVECAKALGFVAQSDDSGNVTITDYQETEHPVEPFLIVIAPYVAAGSSLELDYGTHIHYDGTDLEIDCTLDE